MRLAVIGKHFIEVTEEDLATLTPPTEKIHILKISFDFPTKEKLYHVLNTYDETYRFIIDKYVDFYNKFFLLNKKKYYVENTKKDGLVTFFKRNNKVCFNFTVLNINMQQYCIQNLQDILPNVEVIVLDENLFSILEKDLQNWHGDVIIK